MLPVTLLCLSLGTAGCVVVLDEKNFPKLPNSTVAPPPPHKSINPTTLERAIHEQVNQYRLSQNLPPLKLDPNIIAVARVHSQAMASGRATFSHDGFDQRVEEISRWIDYRSAGENLAYNFGYSDPGKQAVVGWIKSPGHRKNMVGNFDLTGIGVAQNAKGEYYFTQLFIRQR
ncbi:CAP domain-containing protein [Ancylothrix sp. C2]|nr:CAP domain-containing protein [Ancylothrix sp. D3o]MCT7952777.1 CAP domain-containing protein [Ancylothrix sp. D3o]